MINDLSIHQQNNSIKYHMHQHYYLKSTLFHYLYSQSINTTFRISLSLFLASPWSSCIVKWLLICLFCLLVWVNENIDFLQVEVVQCCYQIIKSFVLDQWMPIWAYNHHNKKVRLWRPFNSHRIRHRWLIYSSITTG